MKKNKNVFAVLAAFVFTAVSSAYAQYAVTAPALEAIQSNSFIQQISGWYTAIDNLYATYDLVMNSIKNIENQYTQINKAIENAKSIDWDNIRFDGDFDIRNDLKDANRRVNRLLNQTRRIRDSLTTNVINIPGGPSYSLADLCGMGEDETKDVFSASGNVMKFMSNSMKTAAEAATKGVSYKQGAAIMAKYGISPSNYWFCVQAENQVKTAVMNAIAKAQEQTYAAELIEEDALSSPIIQAALETKDSDGNMTMGAAQEANMHLLQRLSFNLVGLKQSMREAVGLAASKNLQDMYEKEAREQQEVYNDEVNQKVENARNIRFRAFSKSNKK